MTDQTLLPGRRRLGLGTQFWVQAYQSWSSGAEPCAPPTPSGGAWTTAADLHRFVLALQGDKLVSRETRELLWSPTTTSPKYGYGFQTKNGWVGHTGGFDGFESYLYHFPESGHTFILFANYYDSGYPLAIKIRELYPRLIP